MLTAGVFILLLSTLTFSIASYASIRRRKAKVLNDHRSGDDTSDAVAIWFGSQTGTAESLARRFADSLSHKGTKTRIIDAAKDGSTVQKAAHLLSKHKMVVFMQATHGDGEPTDGAQPLFEAIGDADLPADTKFCIFGLGNTQYQHYNYAAKTLRESLLKNVNSPTEAHELGLGDDDGDLEADYLSWEQTAALAASNAFENAKRDTSGGRVGHRQPENKTVAAAQEQQEAFRLVMQGPSAKEHRAERERRGENATVASKRELCDEEEQKSVKHVEIDLHEQAYEAGDHLLVYPQNSEESVHRLARLLCIDDDFLNCEIELEKSGVVPNCPDPPFQGVKTLRYALMDHVEMGLPVPRKQLRALAQHCESKSEADALLASSGSINQWRSDIEGPMVSLLDVLEDHAPSCRPPVASLFRECAQELKPRTYSISSSPLLDGAQRVSLTFSIVNEPKPCGRIHSGVTTHFIANKQVGEGLRVNVRRSSFKLPSPHFDAQRLLFVCAGTGIAPFRGFWRESRAQEGKADGQSNRTCHLLFGCRSLNGDLLYSQEIANEMEGNRLSAKYATSRQREMRYVQDLLRSNDEMMHHAYMSITSGIVYVCGGALGMGKGVHSALRAIIIANENVGADVANKRLDELAKHGRYLRDVW